MLDLNTFSILWHTLTLNPFAWHTDVLDILVAPVKGSQKRKWAVYEARSVVVALPLSDKGNTCLSPGGNECRFLLSCNLILLNELV